LSTLQELATLQPELFEWLDSLVLAMEGKEPLLLTGTSGTPRKEAEMESEKQANDLRRGKRG
jgi:hypothetical protein